MRDMYDYLNISNIPLEKRIEIAIIQTKKLLENLTTERTCKIYSRYLFKYLHDNHVVAKIISTKELGAEYDHFFVIVPINTIEYYLIDLTFQQFNNTNYFKELYEKGYERVTDLNFYLYYAIVTGEQANITINEMMLKSDKVK